MLRWERSELKLLSGRKDKLKFMETRKGSKRELLSILYISISVLLYSCGIIEGK